MDLRLTLPSTFLPPESPLLRRKCHPPTALRRWPGTDRAFPAPRSAPRLAVTAKKRAVIEGVSDEMSAIASQNLDFAPARRRVRSAFAQVQQQLDHCLFKMAPSGIREEEWYERNSRGLEIFCKSWLPKPGVRIKGALCFCHGYGDTCTFFFEGIAKHIAASGYGVYAVDHPGFGLSEGLHGYIPSFDHIVDNVIEQYAKIKGRPEVRGLPFFLLGQSMGGAVALKANLKAPQDWDGVVLVAPMCKISEDVTPPEPAVKALTLLSRVLPKAKLVPQKDLAELVFRELKKRKMASYNVICYSDPVRLKTAVELLKTTKFIESKVEKVSCPLLILHGADDKVTDPLVSQFLYEKASSNDKTLKLYEGGYHGILEGEPDDVILTVLGDIISWLDHRLGFDVATESTLQQRPPRRKMVEHVIREQNIWAAYEILELFCEFILARVPILDSQRECPSELLEAVASIIFAAPRCSDVPDLLHVRNLFAAKYGKEFIAGATELRPDTSVNRTIIEKLSVRAPSAAVKLKVLKDVAEEYSVEWDSSKTEAEFSKKPEDLLNGPKQVYGGPALSQAPPKHGRPEYSTSTEAAHPTISAQRKEDPEFHQSPSPGNITSSLGQDGVIKSTNRNENPTPANDLTWDTRPQSSEILEKARTAIAAAERATATARAAAQLANVKFSTPKLEEQKS
ncbi:hypothetical protein RHMOL_Rhmol09G0156200 [Rhododendron molle]|uniref:Uncharacterized protein n=1 Tax=Rhododendron molle TaxID=49168 RepID=A0ACC0MDR8_RHOML|nr:hypothetical protein RHMOL_Rhmol09G0156200 [Rhododendron molle]